MTVLLIFLIALVAFLIIVCVKLIYTMDKVNVLLDDAYRKLKSVDGIFSAIDTVSDTITVVGESVIGKALLIVDKIFKRKNKEEE